MLTERELTHESNKAMFWLCMWLGSAIVGMLFTIYYVFVNPPYEFIKFALAGFQFAISSFVAVLFAFRYARYNRLLNGDDDEPEPPRPPNIGQPRREPSSALNFQQHPQPPALIVPRAENVLSKCRWSFEPHEWKRLVDQLYIDTDNGRWKWTKGALRRAKIFTAELTPDVNINRSDDYRRICNEFLRLNIIEGGMNQWRVTRPGMSALSSMAGLNVIPGKG